MSALYDFNYDQQVKRFVTQFVRLMSGFQVQFGSGTTATLQRVPVIYGDASKQAQAIMRGNSENMLPTVPAIAVYVSGMKYRRDAVQDPSFVDKLNIRERQFDSVSGTYQQGPGTAFTIERLMPVPYLMTLQADIWTSNFDQQLQLFEQVAPLFNPSCEIQSTDNYIDWTSLSVITLTDITWNTRTIPTTGDGSAISVMSFKFDMPIWVSTPAKVKKLGVIQKIIAGIHDGNGDLSTSVYDVNTLLGQRQFFSPLNYDIMLTNNMLTLLQTAEGDYTNQSNATKAAWEPVVKLYGSLSNGISQIRLLCDDGITEIVGYVSYHPTDDYTLIFNIDKDTLPANTLDPFNAIIDPHKDSAYKAALNATVGTRYLIIRDIGSDTNPPNDGALAWRGKDGTDLIANANDIIQYDGTKWNISFDSRTENSIQYASNLTTGAQFKWDAENHQWVKSYESIYRAGGWTLVL